MKKWMADYKQISMIVLLALALRLLFFLFSSPWSPGSLDRLVIEDGREYYDLAVSMLERHSYNGNLLRTPGQPLIIAALFHLFGFHFSALFIFQILLNTLSVLLVYFLARELLLPFSDPGKSETLALICGFMYAIDLQVVYYSASSYYADINFSFFVYLGILLFLRGVKNGKWHVFALSGAALGAASLIKPSGIYLPAVMPVLYLYRDKVSVVPGVMTKFFMIFLSVFILVLSPWLCRNYYRFNALTFSTAGSVNIYCLALYTDRYLTGSAGSDVQRLLDKEKDYANADVYRRSEIEKKAGMEYIKANPKVFFKFYFINIFRTYLNMSSTHISNALGLKNIIKSDYGITQFNDPSYAASWFFKNKTPWEKAIGIFIFLFFLVEYSGAVLGAVSVLLKKNFSMLLVAGVFIAYFTLLPNAAGQSRYKFPAMPFYLLLFSAGILQLPLIKEIFMSKKRSLLLALVMFLACLPVFSAELSSKAKKAEKLITANDINGAMELYKELMAKDPAKNAALVKEGREGMAKCKMIFEKEALGARRYDESEKYLKEVITDYKDTEQLKEAYADLVKLRVEVAGKLLEAGKYEDCVALLKETRAAAPAETAGIKSIAGLSAKSLFTAGTKAQAAKDYEKALSYYALVSKEDIAPDDPLVVKSAEATAAIGKDLLTLAESQIRSAKYDEALKNIELAMPTSKDESFQAQAKYDTGVAYRLEEKNEKALAAYKEVSDKYRATPYAALAAYDMYLIHDGEGSKREALSVITIASDLKTDNIDYTFQRARLLVETGSPEEGRKIFTALVDKINAQIQKTYSGKEKLQFTLGNVYMSLENYSEAAVEFDKAVIRNPDFAEARKALAAAQFKEKDFIGSQKSYEALIKQASDSYAKLRSGISKTTEPAPEEVQKLEEARTLIAYYHFQNGLCYEQLGDYSKAEQECRLGLEGVATKEAAAAMRRIQKGLSEKPAKTVSPAEGAAAPATAPAAATSTPAASPAVTIPDVQTNP